MGTEDTVAKARTTCPNCARGFNCDGPPDCWCLKVERVFDWEDFIIRTGNSSCVCPVCLTGKTDERAGADAAAPSGG
jgi:hypothetical protein